MASTTLEIIDRVRDLIVDTGTGETFTDDVIIRSALNPVAREIAVLALSESDSTTLTTAAGTREYVIPAAISPFIRIASITIGTDRRQLVWMDRSDLISQTASGSPYAWNIWNNRVAFHPVPSAIETVNIDAYNGADAAVVQDPASATDEYGFSRDVEDCLVYGSAARLCAINREPEREVSYTRDYQSRLGQLRRKLQPDDQGLAVIENRDESDQYFEAF